MRESGRQKSQASPRVPRADAMPAGTPKWITPELARKTILTWQPYYEEQLTLDDAVTILQRVGRLFEVLSRDG